MVKVSQMPPTRAVTRGRTVQLQSLSSSPQITTAPAVCSSSPTSTARGSLQLCAFRPGESDQESALKHSRGKGRSAPPPVCFVPPLQPGWGSRLLSLQALQTQSGAGSGNWGGGTRSSVWSEDILSSQPDSALCAF